MYKSKEENYKSLKKKCIFLKSLLKENWYYSLVFLFLSFISYSIFNKINNDFISALLKSCANNTEFLNTILIVYGFLLAILTSLSATLKKKFHIYIGIFLILILIIIGYQSVLVILKYIKKDLLTEDICKQEIIPMVTYMSIGIIISTIILFIIILNKTISYFKELYLEAITYILYQFFNERFVHRYTNYIKIIEGIINIILLLFALVIINFLI